MSRLHVLFVTLAILFAASVSPVTASGQARPLTAAAATPFALIPSEVASHHFIVTVNGAASPVLHAAARYYLLNFELQSPARITVTADDPHFWDAGVEIQPMRLGIRPQRKAGSITFTLAAPAKISITRPDDFFSDSEMLFLFANEPDDSAITATTPGVRYFGPGVHHGNIDAKSGDRIYLADGAVVFGSLNLWQVHDVSVSGRGTILYDGPQDPDHDEGWMHKPNWHVIVMDNAHNIQIQGITCIVRSRTWMIQMRDSRGILFRNVKVIGGSAENANQDGMDWLGGGDTLVQDSFFRAADDIFAMYGNWDGYTDEALTTPGHEVSNITIEDSVLSTSISNVVRLGWPRKVFNSHGFTLRNSDVLHMGFGGCGVPFALFEIWADPEGKGQHTGIALDNVRLDHWYSLVQLRQPNPGISDVRFREIWSMDGRGMTPSVLKGDVSNVAFKGIDVGSGEVIESSQLPLTVMGAASEPRFEPATVHAAFTYSSKDHRPGSTFHFSVAQPQPGVRYGWIFGDGETGQGSVVAHAFPDAQGTLLDGTGRFRVLLSASDAHGDQAWASESVVIAEAELPATPETNLQPGLQNRPVSDVSTGFVNVPADGGYTFTLLTSTTASFSIDGVRVQSPRLQAQVCGSAGYAVQPLRLSAALARGFHRIEVVRGPEKENAENPEHPLLFWEGPRLRLQIVPAAMLSHRVAER